MKKFYLLLYVFVILLQSCTLPKHAILESYVDFVPYTESGFYITESNSVNFKYQPVGSMSVMVVSGYAKGTKERIRTYDDLYPEEIKIGDKKTYVYASLKEALANMVKEAKAQGGNGIINFKYSYLPWVKAKNGSFIEGSAYEVSGMIINKYEE